MEAKREIRINLLKISGLSLYLELKKNNVLNINPVIKSLQLLYRSQINDENNVTYDKFIFNRDFRGLVTRCDILDYIFQLFLGVKNFYLNSN